MAMDGASPDVIIVGGGIAGAAAAYYLAKDGRSVTLFEKDSIAAHASGFSAGVLLPRPAADASDPEFGITEFSFRLHRELAETLPEESGVDYGFCEKAALMLALDDVEADQFKKLYLETGMNNPDRDIRWLSHGEFSHIEPRVSEEVPGALYTGGVYEVDSYSLTLAFWQAAERNGAKMLNRSVDAINFGPGGVNGVKASGESYAAAAVIVAAGPWSGELLRSCGVNVPVTPLKGQIVRLEAPGPPLKASLWWRGNYANSRPGGQTWCGTTEERVGFDDTPTEAARKEITESVLKILPFLTDAKLVTQTACLRPVTEDGYPAIGRAPLADNLIVSTGAGRHGIAIGPGMGLAAAKLAQGQEPEFDISMLSPARFSQ